MIDWTNKNSVYVFTGVMTEEERMNNILTTAAWTIGFWDELSEELKANFDETLVYDMAKKRGKLLFDIKNKVEDITPFSTGITLLSDESSLKLNDLTISQKQTPEKIEAIVRQNIEQVYLEKIDTALENKDKETFLKETNYLKLFRTSTMSH